MTVINLSIPEELSNFVTDEARNLGYASPAEYVSAVMEAMRLGKFRATLEKTLVDRIEGPAAIELTPALWADLQNRVNKRLEKRAG